MQRENSSYICSRNTKKHIPIKLCLETFEYQTSTTLWKIPVQSSNTNNIKLKLPAMRNPIDPTESQSTKCDILKQARWNEIVKHASVKYVLSNCAPSQKCFFFFFSPWSLFNVSGPDPRASQAPTGATVIHMQMSRLKTEIWYFTRLKKLWVASKKEDWRDGVAGGDSIHTLRKTFAKPNVSI